MYNLFLKHGRIVQVLEADQSNPEMVLNSADKRPLNRTLHWKPMYCALVRPLNFREIPPCIKALHRQSLFMLSNVVL